ncbi:D-alanine--D-alanine ligase family protein [Lachnoclostridium phytofermentans]|uniref:D-alanine--D-alanine ligase n=1 Tax=Lachnoclostridium phytofermentans (strain ATCC 700394 / DSM 18823 / ISDg) TaxID=357809 RepID=A9KQG5_LACP7|nr:D-alanine--D-alanine ligase [Lachnoclostridium phytofermentans]ABX40474.1 D-alanine--D-alanine ligase [Lachnoclostridium phytofermentans ISDg]
MKVVVLAGGLSPEREVSLSSGSKIANALMEKGYEVLLLDLYLGIKDVTNIDSLFRKMEDQNPYQYQVPKEEPNLTKLKEDSGNGGILIGENVLLLCQYADKVFLALHGSIGENGQLQAMFDIYGISYTGSGYIGSLLAMDKGLSKVIMQKHGIETPDYIVADLTEEQELEKTLMLPCVIKPLSCGSSVGVSIVRSQEELGKALDYAKKYENKVLIEELIVGREFSVGILNHHALPLIEIIPKTGFYDYTNKYQAGMATEVCPAQLEDEISIKMQEAALKVHEVLQLGFYSRVDFLLKEDGSFYCLEANTLPGMTPTSLLPQEAAAIGISYSKLCELILLG